MGQTYDRRTTAAEVVRELDLSGKCVVITGVNSGLGFESMRVLALRGAHVIGLARTEDKAREACEQVSGSTTPIACELSDLHSVCNAAEKIVAMFGAIDVVMCNAGIMALEQHQQRYGLEMQFLTNHIGHFLLIRKLEEKLKLSPAGRIVITSSGGHTHAPKGGIEFDNLSGEGNYNAWKTYGQSKLANILCAKAFAIKFKGHGVVVNSLHPGVIRTNLARNAGGWMTKIISLFAPLFERTVEQGAATQVYLAAHPDCADTSGEYFADCRVAKSSGDACDEALAIKLYEVSESIIENYLN